MSPEERQLLVDLFGRIRQNANNPRDREAESFIADQVRAQPYAPYLLAQTVIVQDQALRAANERLQQLEQRVHELESEGSRQGSGGFLGSLFGGGDRSPAPSSVPPTRWGGGPQGGAPGYGQGGYAQQQGYGAPQPGYGQPQGGPWAGGAPSGGGGFLKGALGAAAGVAGGVLLADSIRGLFHGAGNPFGIGSGFGGGGGLGGLGGGDTVINNYYGEDAGAQQAVGFGPDFDPGSNDGSDVLDAGSDVDLGGGGDDTYDV
ncbi:MAG: DUF2076 domain-containing protein [Methylobacteriaceae bacterium]|nr:DUF2076 domain-containing protein [Methylobacteriaceae bacterium]